MVDLNIELPKGFLEEEVRCGYTVTRKMKEVWAVELDLLKEFKRVCNKYDLKYCADGGTLLGAIRHQGFIPWDDDLDIAMLRKDFEKLNEVAPAEFKKPYFWQTEETDKGSARGHAQLRNSDTTGIIKNEYEHQRNNNFNQGIFIDIFPFDTVIDSEEKLAEQDLKRMKLLTKYRETLDSDDFFCFKPWIDESGKRHFNLKKVLRHFKHKLLKDSYVPIYNQFINEITKYDTIDSYRFDELWTVHNQAIEDGVINMAASCLLMQKYGYTTYFSKGSEKNIKITTVEDIEIFKALLSAKNDEWIKK